MPKESICININENHQCNIIIESGIELIEEGTFYINNSNNVYGDVESINIVLPNNINVSGSNLIAFDEYFDNYNVNVFYNGSKEEWESLNISLDDTYVDLYVLGEWEFDSEGNPIIK